LRTVGEPLLSEGLALDGYFHAVETTPAFPDTGDIRADLLTQLRAFAHVMTRTPGGRVLAELIGASQTDAELATAYRKPYSSHRRRLAGERLRRAQEIGQLNLLNGVGPRRNGV
jgi:hypothetical protein